ncbi:MAG: TIGR00153 family protein [Actinomycetia bacterium]|nr:TIGR00153 family protein [Actinomycetes bacterium]
MFGSNTIVGLFGKSPFKPTQKHMEVVEQCASECIPLFEALLAGDGEQVAAHKDRVFVLENEADDVKNQIRSQLPKSLFMPIDRRDLLDLLHAQDSIADTAQDVAGLVTIRELEILEIFRGKLTPYVERNVDAVKQCKEVVGLLDELLEMGFRGREVDQVEEMVTKLGEIESETDDQGIELTGLLFQHGDEMSPPTFFLWYELFQKLGDIADYAEDVGDRLRLLVAR